MGEASPMLIPTFNRALHIEARPDRLSADGGSVLLREMLEQSGIIDWLIARLADCRAQDHIDYQLAELLRTVASAVWPGLARPGRRRCAASRSRAATGNF